MTRHRKGKVTILAIESSADETSAAVITGTGPKFRIASNVIHSQMKIHEKTGGIVPEVAARNHIVKILPVIEKSLAQAKTTLADLDAVAVTAGPGLITALMIGVDTAKALVFASDIPIIPVNHHEGHLLSALGAGNLQLSPRYFPALGLVVSGGHTMLVLVEKIGRYKILGETLDDAAGEAFDKIAKILNLPYPGGPQLARRARKFKNRKAKIKLELPRPMLNSRDYNFSFSGLKTAVLYKVRDIGKLNHDTTNQIAYETEQAIVDVLISKTIRAAKQYKVKTILLGGGVSANQMLRTALAKESKKIHTKYLIPNSSLTTDNAGMIAVAAYYKYQNGKISTYRKVTADPNLRITSWL